MVKEIKDLYTNGEYFQNNPTWHEEESPWKARQILKMIKRNNLQLDSVCEVGCGAGEILNQLYHLLPDHVLFSGFEISPQAYELAMKKNKNRLKYYLQDFLQESNSLYDLLLVIDVIEHVEDYFGFLKSLRERAEYKIFLIPLDISINKILLSTPIDRRRKEVGHIHYFTKETALATLADTGYKILDFFYTKDALELPARSILFSLGKLPLLLASKLNEDLAVRILGGHSLLVLAN